MRNLLNIENLRNSQVLAAYRPDLFSTHSGISVSGKKIPDPGYAVIDEEGKSIQLGYHDYSDLMTALGDIISGVEAPSFKHSINFRGLMLDASRNGVPCVEFLKRTLVNLALLGINYFCLYTEDTYEVSGEPLIGFGRGRYSKEEIRDLVKFSSEIGITMFPCIQTLGHLEQILKYRQYGFLRDTERVLNALQPETYEFLEHLLDEVTEPYDTDLIHVGMDETWGIGRGNAFTEEYPVRPLKIYAEHVAKVADICRKKGMKPVMWGDFILGKTEKPMDSYERSLLPENMTMNYWEYASEDEEEYRRNIREFRSMGYEPVFSPGMHCWGRFFPLTDQMSRCSAAGMKVAHEEKIERVLMTMWGDDGNECLFSYNYPGLVLYSELLKNSSPDNDMVEKRLKRLFDLDTGISPDISDRLHSVMRDGSLIDPKMLFYDDPLYGYVTHLLKDPKQAAVICANIAEELTEKAIRKDSFRHYYILESSFYSILASKIRVVSDARDSYHQNNRSELAILANSEAQLLIDKISKFRTLYRDLWLSERKSFGFEVMDIRLSGIEGRLDSFIKTLNAFLNNRITEIEEFEIEIPKILTKTDLATYKKVVTRSQSIW